MQICSKEMRKNFQGVRGRPAQRSAAICPRARVKTQDRFGPALDVFRIGRNGANAKMRTFLKQLRARQL
jgi:hypothetical protein